MLKARCHDADPEIFFGEGQGTSYYRDALKLCNECPVREKCLEYALENDIWHGVWGGVNERQLRRLRKLRKNGISRHQEEAS